MAAVPDEHDDTKVNLNRAMVAGKNDPKHELQLEEFDVALRKAIDKMETTESTLAQLNAGNHIPQEIKDAFSLPKNIKKDYEIDFEQVRIADASLKRRTPIWSGQEVLDTGLNIDKSKWVLKKMNKLRVWPKGFYNTVKKFRCVLK